MGNKSKKTKRAIRLPSEGKSAKKNAELEPHSNTVKPREVLAELATLMVGEALELSDGAATEFVDKKDKKTRSTRSFDMSYKGLVVGVLLTVYRT
jgi:hypothetical protein